MDSAARGSAVLIMAFFITSFLNYAFNLGVGWLLSPEEFGMFGVSLSFLVILQLITSSGFPRTVSKFLAEDRPDKEKILKTSLLGSLILGTITGSIFYLLFKLGLIGLGENYDPLIGIIAPTVIITSMGVVAQHALQGQFKFGGFAAIGIVGATTQLIFGVGLILLGLGVFGVVFAMMISSLVTLALAFFLTSDLKFWKETGWASLSLFKFAAPMFVGTVSLTLLMQIDILGVKFLVADASSDQLAGYYQSAIVLARFPIYIIGAVMGAVFPFISTYSTNGKKNAKIYINKSIKYACIFIIPISLAFFLISKSLIILLFPEKYLPGAPALSIVSIGMAFLVLITVFSRSFQALGKPLTSAKLLTLSVVVQIILLTLLVPFYGVVGAALSTTIACFFGLIVLAVTYIKNYGLDVKTIDILKIIISFVILGLVLVLFPHPTRILTIIDLLVSGGIYLIVLVLLGLFTEEDLDILLEALPKNKYLDEILPIIHMPFKRRL